MDIAVLGATGTIGRLVADRLEGGGQTVRRLSRSASGVDTATGEGLQGAIAGADVVVDATNIASFRASRAVPFFATSAKNIAAAAKKEGVGRVVCISIAGVTRAGAGKRFGYYRGKSAQERAYRAAPVPTTIVRSTQWFEFASLILPQASVGPIAVLPTMKMAPVAAERAADHIAEEIIATGHGEVPEIRPGQNARLATDDGEDPANRIVAVCGPEVMTTAQLVRKTLAARGDIEDLSPRVVTELPYLGRALAGGVLIPQERNLVVDDLTLDSWLER
ncbi:epimerase [Brachybacterium endophyticum]|uniref:Epimerase n=1 Tax=Brachybacterium endophyticum TaxID=2182385 RepID=A0A2U2RJI3_9MICO|nr:NAD(P)H-binding protein [Brachybacterium endophyticum]PWH06020.1 epimerase [Brachybacterium endophyticum]